MSSDGDSSESSGSEIKEEGSTSPNPAEHFGGVEKDLEAQPEEEGFWTEEEDGDSLELLNRYPERRSHSG